MSKTIKIRYKHPDMVGDIAAFTAQGAANGFPRSVFGGDEADIPADELDDKQPFKLYKHKGGKEEMVTEKQHRALLYEHGGFQGPRFNDAAPEAKGKGSFILPPRKMNHEEFVEFLSKQKAATLKYRHFNPMCMELISELDGAPAKTTEKERTQEGTKGHDFLKMKPKEAIEHIKTITDEAELTALMVQEDKSDNPRPAVISVLDARLKSVRKV